MTELIIDNEENLYVLCSAAYVHLLVVVTECWYMSVYDNDCIHYYIIIHINVV